MPEPTVNPDIDALIDLAIEHHRAGRLDAAAEAYDAALALNAGHPDALHLRGVVAHQAGDHDRAAGFIEKAIDADPTAAEFYSNLGEVERARHDFARAIKHYRRALELDPGRIETLRNLGLAAQEMGDLEVALGAWDAALAIEPRHADTLNNRGVTLRHLRRADEAMEDFQSAAEERPDFREPLDNLVATLNGLGRHEDAITVARLLVARRPVDPSAYVSLGSALSDAGRPKEAIPAFYEALKLDPLCVAAHVGMGMVFAMTRELKGAELAFQRALNINAKNLPAFVQLSYVQLQRGEPRLSAATATVGLKEFPASFELHINLTSALYQAQLFEGAADIAEKATKLRPLSSLAFNLLGTILTRTGEYERADQAYRQGLIVNPSDMDLIGNYATMTALKGDLSNALESFRACLRAGTSNPDLHSNMLLYLNGMPGVTPQEVFEEHRAWGQRHAAHLTPTASQFGVTREPDRPLRVGYVSADWRFHSVAYFVAAILEGHDRDRVWPVVYDSVAQPDAMTAQLRNMVGEWHRVVHLSNEEMAQRVRDDKIDILVDLSGHTGGHRLPLFARRAAPVQVTYLGYPNTTGMPGMDYRLTDAIADPPGVADTLHTETLARVEAPFICFRPSPGTPDVAELPALKNGWITFCSFNAISKFNARAIEVWARVLQALPESRLLIKAPGLQDAQTKQRVLDYFSACHIAESRLEMMPRAPTYESHLMVYNQADIAFDTFPYNGTTTTCEALWMGVPVLTIAGDSHVSRVSASILHSTGLSEFVADDAPDFERIACQFANDLPRLAEVRRSMRQTLLASPLLDARRKAAAIEAAYRNMWKTWLKDTEAVPMNQI